MKHFCVLVSLLLIPALLGHALEAQEEVKLFPQPKILKTGHLEVSDLHKILYRCFGSPEGKPVMCLHGGPGVGSYPRLAQYFDPEKFYIVLHDQRGTGGSEPQGELRENTTPNLVKDIEALRKHLDLGKVLIFGGSWGSTLGLAYAETYPDHVTGLFLRGVFLGTEAEIEYHYMGNRFFFPKEHDALLSALPDPKRGTHPDYLYELIKGDDEALRDHVLEALHRFELKFMKLHMPDEMVTSILKNFSKDEGFRMTNIDLHYVTNRYFMEEGQLLRDIHKIQHIPVTLINGRYDMAAPPRAAYQVHRSLPQSKLVLVEEAGHSESEEGITAALLKAAGEFE